MNNSSTGNSPDNNSKKNRFTLRRILRAISCVIAAAGLLMITRSIVNAAFLSNYEQENYSRFPEITNPMAIVHRSPIRRIYLPPRTARRFRTMFFTMFTGR